MLNITSSKLFPQIRQVDFLTFLMLMFLYCHYSQRPHFSGEYYHSKENLKSHDCNLSLPHVGRYQVNYFQNILLASQQKWFKFKWSHKVIYSITNYYLVTSSESQCVQCFSWIHRLCRLWRSWWAIRKFCQKRKQGEMAS